MTMSPYELKNKANACIENFARRINPARVGLLVQLPSKHGVSVDYDSACDEILCFAAYCIARNSQNYIRKRRFFFFYELDNDGYRQYCDHIGDCLSRELRQHSLVTAYAEYFNANLGSPSIAKMMSTSYADENPYARLVDSQFKVPLFATRLAEIMTGSTPIQAVDLLPFGRQIAEETAGVTKGVFGM